MKSRQQIKRTSLYNSRKTKRRLNNNISTQPIHIPSHSYSYIWNENNMFISASQKNKECIILIPIYKRNNLTNFEKESLKQCCNVLGNDYEICFLCPQSLNTMFVYDTLCPSYNFSHFYVNDEWLSSQRNYANLCVVPELYETLKDYKYVLIYQLDAWVCHNDLKKYIDLDYDYYGAPIPNTNEYNGGLSLRKVSTCIKACNECQPYGKLPVFGLGEDRFFSNCQIMNVAPRNVNEQFSCQENQEVNENIFGLHYYTKPLLFKQAARTQIDQDDSLLFLDKKSKMDISTKDNINLFICAHKNFTCQIFDKKHYKIVTSQGITINDSILDILYENGVEEVSNMQRGYGEFSRMYYIAKKLELPDYVGICHYRRYYDFSQMQNTISTIFKTHDVIAHTYENMHQSISLYEWYRKAHNINDLDECIDIAQKVYNIDNENIEKFKNSTLISNNMLILPKEQYIKWVDFLYSIISQFNINHNLKTDNDVLEYVISNRNKYSSSQPMEYQARLQGFLIERLTTLFVQLYCPRIFFLPYIFIS